MKILMIAYHFPPILGSSGVQRTLHFSRYLKAEGWDPIVLTVNPIAYENTSNDNCNEMLDGVIVKRVLALDTAKHLSIKGKYPGFLAVPDRWVSWKFTGFLAGLYFIKKYRPKIIWSTYPIATAHSISLALHNVTKLPLVADFRDSMIEEGYPDDPVIRSRYLKIEKGVIRASNKVIFTTESTRNMYHQRYKDLENTRSAVIYNGYDEDLFSKKIAADCNGKVKSKVKLLHSGLLYPVERDPTSFFQAVSQLKKEQLISSDKLEIIMRAPGHEDTYKVTLRELDIEDLVKLEPAIPYKNALSEMMSACGLLLFQASNCNHQIPAKIYEYFRAQKPILLLTDKNGDTGKLAAKLNAGSIIPLDDTKQIKKGLIEFLLILTNGRAPIADLSDTVKYSRENQAKELSDIFLEIVNQSQT